MASLDLVTHGGRNVWRVRAYIGKRRETISLGVFDESDSQIAKEHIEHLIDSKARNRLPPRASVRWLESIPLELHERLSILGLVEARAFVEAERTLIAYLRAYVKERTDWKKPENYKQAIDSLNRS